MAAKKKHAPSVLLTEEENSMVREILGQKKYVSYQYLNQDSLLFYCYCFENSVVSLLNATMH